MERNNYKISTQGGRIKSAGLPFDFITNQGDDYAASPTPSTAAELGEMFKSLRRNPPKPLRDRFFPLDRAGVKTLTHSTPALLRPVLKTDQGPGMFLPFTMGQGSQIATAVVTGESGYIIPESYYAAQLQGLSFDDPIHVALANLRDDFGQGELERGRDVFNQLAAVSEDRGLQFNRKADVGRRGLFFIHPGIAQKDIELPANILDTIHDEVHTGIEELIDRAQFLKRRFCAENGLPFREIDSEELPSYLQADIHISTSGGVRLAELQVPDVAFFLGGLEDLGNPTIKKVKGIVGGMRAEVMDAVAARIRQKKEEKGDIPVYLVSRSEVINEQEDTLEIMELQQIVLALEARGYPTTVISALQGAEIDSDCMMFLMNIDPTSEEFAQLAKRHLLDPDRKITMVPDPFVKAAERDITHYDRVRLSGQSLNNFITLSSIIEGTKDVTFMQMNALEGFLRKAGVTENVVHIYHPLIPTPIPIYLHDLKGIQIAAKVIEKLGLQEIELRSIPLSGKTAHLKSQENNSFYSVCRFMVYKSQQ